MKRILCFGDSNTWGAVPCSNLRYSETERWTKVLQNLLKQDYEIIEEGLPSRTMCTFDTRPERMHTMGSQYFVPCVHAHDKIDCILLMLGTNELKSEYQNTCPKIVNMLKIYVNFVKNFKSKIDNSTPKLIICGIPTIDENNYTPPHKFEGATKKAIEVNKMFGQYCKENNITFVDNSDLTVGADGVHLTLEAHKLLANKLAEILKKIT